MISLDDTICFFINKTEEKIYELSHEINDHLDNHILNSYETSSHRRR